MAEQNMVFKVKVNDIYMKVILTVIAICLIYFVAKDISIIPKAHASYNPTGTSNVIVKNGSFNAIPVRIVK